MIAGGLIVLTLIAATSVTGWQAYVARRERTKAEQRFNDVRHLAHSVVFDFHDAIQNLPGSTPARELLVSRALEYLDKLANEAEDDSSLQLELADAYDKIGDIQGGLLTSHLGQRHKADESYRKALAIRETLVAAEPNNVDFRRRLSTSYTKRAQVLFVEADMAGSLEFHGKALVINQTLAAELPDNTGLRFDLSASYRNFGYMLGANGRLDDAMENSRKGLVLLEELAADDPNNIEIQKGLGVSYMNIADIITSLTENHSEALMFFRKYQEIAGRLLAVDPTNTKLRRSEAVSHYHIALVLAKLGDTKTALEGSRRSVSILTEMSLADPQNEDLRQTIATMQTFACQMMIKTGNAAGAIDLLNQSLISLERSFAASPTDETVHFRIAGVQAELGKG